VQVILRSLRWLGQRRILVVLDHATSSLSNVVVTVMVARMVTPDEFGSFSVAIVAFQLALSGVQAAVGEPWLSVYSADDSAVRVKVSADLLAGAFATSVVGSAVIGVAAAVVGDDVSGALVALAFVLPFCAMQEALRHVAIVDRPQVALASDLVWLAVVVGLLAVAPAGASAAWFVVAWGIGGAAGLAVALWALELSAPSGSATRWFANHRSMAAAFLAETASARGAAQAVLLALGPIAGLAAVGAVRAAQVFYGPLNTLHRGIFLMLVPDGVRQKDEPAKLVRLMVTASAVVSAAAVAWMVVGLGLPDSWGARLFGETWGQANELMFPMGLAMVAGSAATGAFVGLRSLADAQRSLRARLWSLPPQTLIALAGALVGAAAGYAYGFTIGTVAVGVIWWRFFMISVGAPRPRHLARNGFAVRDRGRSETAGTVALRQRTSQ
jgi:hypothetical protein